LRKGAEAQRRGLSERGFGRMEWIKRVVLEIPMYFFSKGGLSERGFGWMEWIKRIVLEIPIYFFSRGVCLNVDLGGWNGLKGLFWKFQCTFFQGRFLCASAFARIFFNQANPGSNRRGVTYW
jgi:hypothetical protein